MKLKTKGKATLALALGMILPMQSAFADGTATERKGVSKSELNQAKMSLMNETGLQVTDMHSLTPEDLVRKILGNDVQVSNVHLSGVGHSSGLFTGGQNIFGFEEGVILSSGSVHNVVGPNQSDSISDSNGLGGDSDLDTLVGGSKYDTTYLEFDFVPRTDTVKFQYVFASDEYNEYAGSSYNDVFGFFLNGQNVALIPGTTTPVSINNVNGYTNSQYFINNDLSDGGGSINTEMDGFTTVLNVEASVNKNEVNHIKLAIADLGDDIYDSNVFIKANSFTDNPNEVSGEGTLEGKNAQFGLFLGEQEDGKWSGKLNYAETSQSGALMIAAEGAAANVTFDEFGRMVEFDIPVKITKISYPLQTASGRAHVKVVDNGESGDQFELTITKGTFKGITTGLSNVETGNISVIY
jgi:hypothetical protein